MILKLVRVFWIQKWFFTNTYLNTMGLFFFTLLDNKYNLSPDLFLIYPITFC
jgi:hypothetical protein